MVLFWKKIIVYMLLAGMFTALLPAGRVQAEEASAASEEKVAQQEGTLEGKTTFGKMQGIKGGTVQWRWTAGKGIEGVKGCRTLWGGGKSPVKTEVRIDKDKGSRYADACTEVTGAWEEKDGSLYLLCSNKKKGLLTYIVADKKGKVKWEGRVDFAKTAGKAPSVFHVYDKVRLDKKGRMAALYYAKVSGKIQRGLLAIETKKGKCTLKKLKNKNWDLQDDGTPLQVPGEEMVKIDETLTRLAMYACHGSSIYKIGMTGDIYKKGAKDKNFRKISTGSAYTADPAITDDSHAIAEEYFLSDCCVSGDGKKLYVRYWKGLDECFEDDDEVYYMVSYKLQ